MSFWEDKILFLFEKWWILSQGPDILFTAYEDHQWEDSIPHKHFNIGLWIEPQMLSATGTAADLETLRPYFLLYQQQRRQGHWAWTGVVWHKVLVQCDLNPGESLNQPWRLSASFHHTKLKPALAHCWWQGNPKSCSLRTSPLSFGACNKVFVQNIILNCASRHWELCVTWQPWLKAHMEHGKALLPPRISSPSSSHLFLMDTQSSYTH